MKICNAEYIFINKHPFLRLEVDDKKALIGELKWSMVEAGYIYLSSSESDVNWETILPEIHIPASETMNELNLKGFTNNPTIVAMARDYWKAINHLDGKKFQEGPVNIP